MEGSNIFCKNVTLAINPNARAAVVAEPDRPLPRRCGARRSAASYPHRNHRRRPATCPRCGPSTARVHSRYTRTMADVPWAEVAVRLRLRVRKFVCPTPDCPRRIFTERLPASSPPGHGEPTGSPGISVSWPRLGRGCRRAPGVSSSIRARGGPPCCAWCVTPPVPEPPPRACLALTSLPCVRVTVCQHHCRPRTWRSWLICCPIAPTTLLRRLVARASRRRDHQS